MDGIVLKVRRIRAGLAEGMPEKERIAMSSEIIGRAVDAWRQLLIVSQNEWVAAARYALAVQGTSQYADAERIAQELYDKMMRILVGKEGLQR